MSEPQRTGYLPNLPYRSFVELQRAVKDGKVSIGIERDQPFKLASGGYLSRAAYWLTVVTSFCWLWSEVPLIYFAWPSLGWLSLMLMPLGFASTLVSRPWSPQLVLSLPIAATAIGFVGELPVLGWFGAAWVIACAFTLGTYLWCERMVMRRLATDEEFFAAVWATGSVRLETGSAARPWPDAG